MIAKNRPHGCATGFDASLSRRNCRPGKQNGSGRFPGPYKTRFTLIAIEQYSTNATFAAQVSEREKRRVAALRERRLRVARELPQQNKNRFRKQRQRAWVLAEQIALKPKRIGLAAMREG